MQLYICGACLLVHFDFGWFWLVGVCFWFCLFVCLFVCWLSPSLLRLCNFREKALSAPVRLNVMDTLVRNNVMNIELRAQRIKGHSSSRSDGQRTEFLKTTLWLVTGDGLQVMKFGDLISGVKPGILRYLFRVTTSYFTTSVSRLDTDAVA